MELKLTVKVSVLLFLAGVGFYYFFKDTDSAIWFALGGGLALLNIFYAAFCVRFGLKSAQKKSLFLGLLLVKSLTFVTAVAAILIFLKPQLLPFTLGIGLVIFGSIGAALFESFTRKDRGEISLEQSSEDITRV